MRKRSVPIVFIYALFVSLAAAAQSADNADLSIADRMLQTVEPGDISRIEVGEPPARYDAEGFPETAAGQLALEYGAQGLELYLQGDDQPYLLYAQYENVQRDAVFLARTGPVTDVLPSGEPFVIPYGYGALKQNAVRISIVEALLFPHVGDNQKRYTLFPVNDLYAGIGFGLSGLTAGLRLVLTETWVISARSGLSLSGSGAFGQFSVPLHLSGGFRFPTPLRLPFTGTNWTVGFDALLGVGDGDSDPGTPSAIFLPGAFLDIEHVLYDERASRREFRTDPRPFNYFAHAIVLRGGAYLDGADAGTGLILPFLELRYEVSVIGPRIPAHEFKQTEVVYVDELYVDELRSQQSRRDARNAQ